MNRDDRVLAFPQPDDLDFLGPAEDGLPPQTMSATVLAGAIHGLEAEARKCDDSAANLRETARQLRLLGQTMGGEG